jgi:Tfp pilus assembly protein PilF
MFEAALILNPQSFNGLCSLAFVLHVLGQYDLAIKRYHQALLVHPDHDGCSSLLSMAIVSITAVS